MVGAAFDSSTPALKLLVWKPWTPFEADYMVIRDGGCAPEARNPFSQSVNDVGILDQNDTFVLGLI